MWNDSQRLFLRVSVTPALPAAAPCLRRRAASEEGARSDNRGAHSLQRTVCPPRVPVRPGKGREAAGPALPAPSAPSWARPAGPGPAHLSLLEQAPPPPKTAPPARSRRLKRGREGGRKRKERREEEKRAGQARAATPAPPRCGATAAPSQDGDAGRRGQRGAGGSFREGAAPLPGRRCLTHSSADFRFRLPLLIRDGGLRGAGEGVVLRDTVA